MSESDASGQLPESRARKAARRGNLLFALAMLGVAGVFFHNAITTLNLKDDYGPGPGFIPAVASVGCMIISVYLIWQSFRGVYDSNDVSLSRIGAPLRFFGALIVSLLLVPLIGLLPGIGLFMFIALVFVEGISYWRAALVSAGAVLAAYLLLGKLLADQSLWMRSSVSPTGSPRFSASRT
jgi:hypothetical protein